jgi:uncharacterized membrane protein
VSDLAAVAYPDKETAETVRARLMQLVTEHVIELEDAVVVDRDEDGKVKLHQLHSPAAAGGMAGKSRTAASATGSWPSWARSSRPAAQR